MNSKTNEPFVRFRWQQVKDPKSSRAEGRDIFTKEVYVTIRHPGRKDLEIDAPATETHKKQFATAYSVFKNTEEEPETGTPLKMVPIFGVDAIATLGGMGIKTLEKFVGLSRDEVKDFPAVVRDLHKPALAYLEAATDNGALARKYAASQEIIELQAAKIAQLESDIQKSDTEVKAAFDLRKELTAERGKVTKLTNERDSLKAELKSGKSDDVTE